MNSAIEEYCRLNNIQTSVNSDESEYIEGYSKLKNLKGISIKQSFQPIEFFTGFQQENFYEVFGINEFGQESSSKIFECREKSNLFLRLFLSPETRPFQARIINYPLNSDFIQLKRRFQCTFFCYNRPRLDVILNENGQKNYLGFIVLPCKLSCDYRLEIWQNRKRKFIIIGSCCQLGIILKSLPCEDCQSAEFSLIDAQNGGELSKIRKKSAGFWKSALSEADNFELSFPSSMTVEDKALVMAATIFLDFNFFESKKRTRNNYN